MAFLFGLDATREKAYPNEDEISTFLCMSPLCLRPFDKTTTPCHTIVAGIEAYARAYRVLSAAGSFPAHNSAAQAALADLLGALSLPLSEGAVDTLLASPEVQTTRPHMWRALARYEAGVERAIAAGGDLKRLEELPLYTSQHLLTQAEVALLGGGAPLFLESGGRIAFVDTGPLPLGALLTHLETGLPVTCFGANVFDAKLGQRFLRRLGLSERAIRFDPALEPPMDPHLYPLMLVESRVQRKKQLLRRWRMAEGAVQIGIRSAVGLYGLLYAPLRTQLEGDLFMYFDRRTAAAPGCYKTTYFSAAPSEGLIFEKEEPKPDWGDVHFCTDLPHLTHG